MPSKDQLKGNIIEEIRLRPSVWYSVNEIMVRLRNLFGEANSAEVYQALAELVNEERLDMRDSPAAPTPTREFRLHQSDTAPA